MAACVVASAYIAGVSATAEENEQDLKEMKAVEAYQEKRLKAVEDVATQAADGSRG